MPATIDSAQRHALNHYVLTGQTHLLDGYDSPSEGTSPKEVERWRTRVDAGDFLIQPRSLPTESATPQVLPRRRSSGQQSPSPATSLPANSRADATVPRDIAAWCQAVPLGIQPPGDVPWSSRSPDSDSTSNVELEEQLISHTDRKPGPDIATALSSTPPTTLPPSTGSVDIHQWRYENYVDWWRSGMAAQQGNMSPPPPIKEVAQSRPTSPDQGEVVSPAEDAGSGRSPPTLNIPPPPPHSIPPEPQVIRVVEIPSMPPPSSKTRLPSHENLKRGAYPSTIDFFVCRTRNDEPLPVRDSGHSGSPKGDKSIGVLFLENPWSYRAGDLMTIILSRECSNVNSPSSGRYSPRLRKKLTDQTSGNTRSPTSASFTFQQQLPQLKVKLKLYYDAAGHSNIGFGHTPGGKRRRLKDNDVLPPGIGLDESSALIAKVFTDETAVIGQPLANGNQFGKSAGGRGFGAAVRMSRRGAGAIVKALARGVRSIGDGLGKFADCLSGSTLKSRPGSVVA
ncbi:hypothetical protein FRB99_001420 [Tulasnella sp. 403]|nr:hypothetical protein FRB99_001420 [Tulasnella sp. 403]